MCCYDHMKQNEGSEKCECVSDPSKTHTGWEGN